MGMTSMMNTVITCNMLTSILISLLYRASRNEQRNEVTRQAMCGGGRQHWVEIS